MHSKHEFSKKEHSNCSTTGAYTSQGPSGHEHQHSSWCTEKEGWWSDFLPFFIHLMLEADRTKIFPKVDYSSLKIALTLYQWERAPKQSAVMARVTRGDCILSWRLYCYFRLTRQYFLAVVWMPNIVLSYHLHIWWSRLKGANFLTFDCIVVWNNSE